MQKFFDNVFDRNGSVIAGAVVTVSDAATGALSTIYSNNSLGVKANPITCDSNGYFEFYAANGRYNIDVTGAGLQTRHVTDVLLEDITGTGADLVGFTPAGTSAVVRTSQDKMRDLVNIVDYGADATGVVDSSAAIAAAWAAVKAAGTVKKGIYGDGNFRLSSSVALAGTDNLNASTDAGSNVVIDIATITPDSGIGVAITIHGLRRPRVHLSFTNGGVGAETDVGVEWYDVEGMDFNVYGSNFNGLLCKFDGNKGIWVENNNGIVSARKCYKALDWSGVSTASHNTGTGRVASVWDILPTKGSVIQNLDDLTVEHYENTIIAPTFTASNSLSITSVNSSHFGTIALGKDGPNLLVWNGCTGTHIKDLYVFGGNTSGSGTVNGVLAYNNALCTIGRFNPSGCARGLFMDGNCNLDIDDFQALNNTNDVVFEKVSGSSFSVVLNISKFFSQAVYAESIKAIAGGITGSLTLAGGRIRSGNVGAAGTAGIDTSVSAGSLFTRCNGLEIDASWTTSVKTVDKAKFAGYGNNFLGTTPIIDAGGRKGSLDGRTWLINVPALAFATDVQNANPYPVAIWIPLRFETTALASDFATLKLTDYEGNVHDLVDTSYAGTTFTSAKFFTLRAIVPAGWSYQIASSSGGTRVTFQGVPRSIRI